ncbi:MAG TPA: 5-oxoprolinase subunit PxpA [Thermoanaerobaculaceae bacterium]|nr:5-oxoprolinase subunit PxpA [Thermoanaerobaculaceae bacterium]HPS77576.1 5-oxoprolinase subunit PxpA [Thermoanaerobaculaceae bacterium]
MTSLPRRYGSIDVNLDAGERPEAVADRSEEALLALVSSVNIACGGHAGDEAAMAATLASAHRLGVACGAHPGYPDRLGFGRTSLAITPGEIAATVEAQVRALDRIAGRLGVQLTHVKPHGALYNDAACNVTVAVAVARGAAPWSGRVRLVGLAGAPCLEVYRQAGFAVLAEAFAERRYEPDGTLRLRRYPDAVLHDPEEAAAQAVGIALDGEVKAVNGCQMRLRADTLCIHSDSPGALAVAKAVREALASAGIIVAAPGAP